MTQGEHFNRQPVCKMSSTYQWNPEHLAELWVRRMEGDTTVDERVLGAIVTMDFVAPPDVRWEFLVKAVDLAKDNGTLGHLAAGTFEQLLSKHGDEYIERVEALASKSAKFALMVSGAWQHLMTDDNWARVKAIKAKVRGQV